MVKNDNSERSISEEIIAELSSGYNESGFSGPSKSILGVNFTPATDTDSMTELKGLLTIDAHQESPWGDTANTQRSFEVTLDVLKAVAESATNFRGRLKIISEEFSKMSLVHADAKKEQFEKAVKNLSKGHGHTLAGPATARFKATK